MARGPSSPPAPDDPMPSRVNPLDWPRVADRVENVADAVDAFVRRRRRRRVAACAAGAACLLAAVIGWREFRGRTSATTPLAEAAPNVMVSAPSRRTLPDGSVVELKAEAEIAVEFTASSTGLRRVVLKHGEAHFSVEKNPRRPFVVAVDGIEVRAVGTAFSVQRGDTEVEVLVTEGRVAVDKPAPPAADRETAVTEAAPSPPPLAFVDAGSRAVVATDRPQAEAQVHAISAPELEERLSWRVPRLEFNATPLAEVIAMFNRHAARRPGTPNTVLTLSEPGLRILPLSGTLRADNVAVLLQILDSSYGIRAERRPDGEILLRKAP